MTPPTPALLTELGNFAQTLANAARARFAPAIGHAPGVEIKADRSLVTLLDKAIEDQLRNLIEASYPDHGILGEEHGQIRPDAEYVWVLDPIDGTAPFIAGVPVYGTLIALIHRGTPVIGIIDLPVTQERWIGVAGRPTLYNNHPCHTRACVSLADAMLSTSNPDLYSDADRPVLDALRRSTRWRIYGASCMAYGLLANGRTDIAIDAGFKFWDYAPYVPIIEGAGGAISDWQGRALRLDGWGSRVLASGDPQRHPEVLALVRAQLG